MNTKEIIESGIIELYCLGIASNEEQSLIEQLAKNDPMVLSEISSVNDALAFYAVASSATHPPPALKGSIMKAIQGSIGETAEINLPPTLTAHSTINEWVEYLRQINVEEPKEYEGVYFTELPGTEDYYSYAVFAKPGGIVDEENHTDHQEYLLICSGECEMVIGGKRSTYKAGDFIEITPGIPHSAIVTGKERMLVIGQRRAA